MNVVHFSITRLAGAPIRLVKALREYGEKNPFVSSQPTNACAPCAEHTASDAPAINARLVDLDDWGHYDTDIVFSSSAAARDEAIELAENADIIHLHNYLDRDSHHFAPIDFAELECKGKVLLRHFHSTPDVVAATMGCTPDRVLGCDIPSIVIAQYPERFYPRAMVVPNLVPDQDPDYMPLQGDSVEVSGVPAYDVVFTPTKLTSAWEDRWNTKGAPETTAMIEAASLNAGTGRIKVINDQPLSRVLQAKRDSRIVVDDLVNGSYHLSGLEGLCLAKPVLAWLDDRARRLLYTFAGTTTCPFINVRLEEAQPVLEHLLRDEELCRHLGNASRRWIEQHWSVRQHVARFHDVYETLGSDPARIQRQKDLAIDTPDKLFKTQVLHELVFQARKRRALAERGE